MSGAQRRKKKKEKEAAVKEAVADMERLKLGPTKLWTGLVTHHKDVFVSHVIPKLNRTDQFFFSRVNRESWEVLAYAGVNVSRLVMRHPPPPTVAWLRRAQPLRLGRPKAKKRKTRSIRLPTFAMMRIPNQVDSASATMVDLDLTFKPLSCQKLLSAFTIVIGSSMERLTIKPLSI